MKTVTITKQDKTMYYSSGAYTAQWLFDTTSYLPDGCYITSATLRAEVWQKSAYTSADGIVQLGLTYDTRENIEVGTSDAPYVYEKDVKENVIQSAFGSFNKFYLRAYLIQRTKNTYFSNVSVTINYEQFSSVYTLPSENEVVAGEPIQIGIEHSRPDTTCEVIATCSVDDEHGGVLILQESTGVIEQGITAATITIPLTWANDMTTSLTKRIDFKIQTTGYAQGDETKTAKTLTSYSNARMLVFNEADVAPSIDEASIIPVTKEVLGDGTFLQNYGVTTTVSKVTLLYGATISRISLSISGTVYEMQTGLPSVSTTVMSTSGDKTFTLTVYDSRGVTATFSKTISVTPYSLPRFISCKATRCDAEGKVSDYGDNLKVYADYAYSDFTYGSDAKNEVSCGVSYSEDSGTTYSNVRMFTEPQAEITYENLTSDKSYLFRFVLTDVLNTTIAYLTAEAAVYTMHFKAGGKAVWIGQSSYGQPDNTFGVSSDWATHLDGDVYFGSTEASSELCLAKTYTATVSADSAKWSQDTAAGMYVQSVSVAGLTDNDVAVVDANFVGKASEQISALTNAMAQLCRVESTKDALLVYSKAAQLKEDVPIRVFVVRKIKGGVI